MKTTKKIADALTAAATMLLTGAIGSAGTSTATTVTAPWLAAPNSCANILTAVQRDVNGRTVQVRYSTCGGIQYDWDAFSTTHACITSASKSTSAVIESPTTTHIHSPISATTQLPTQPVRVQPAPFARAS